MRTTVQINDALLDQAKREALRRHTTLGAVIDEALRKLYATKQTSSRSPAADLPVFKGNGVLHTEVIRAAHAEQIIRLGDKHGMMHAASTFDGTAEHVFRLPASCELAR